MNGLHLGLFVLLAFVWTWSFWLPSALAGWIYNGTGGSILLVVLFHAVSNAVSAIAPVNFHASAVALAATMAFVVRLVGTGRLQRSVEPRCHGEGKIGEQDG
jgi:hypothetical protein